MTSAAHRHESTAATVYVACELGAKGMEADNEYGPGCEAPARAGASW
jgi:hypothetical protein